jgi:AcrR family transcriptional regulator
MKAQLSVESEQKPARDKILCAAMEAFLDLGYAAASTLEIATRAQVSKRELYTHFGNKQAMLAACIADRAQRMKLPTELPPARTREMLGAILGKFGATILREVCDPAVMGVFWLAITEVQRAPEVAQTLETARRSTRETVRKVVTQAQSAGLLAAADPAEMSGRFLALLWGDLQVSLLLRVREAPGAKEIERRAHDAVADFLRLYP